MSKIEQIISEIEDYIDNCKLQPLSNTKIIVNRNDIEEYIMELRDNVPEEIRKYQRIIANRDAILKDAQNKAEEMIKKANEMTIQLVSEHEIMQQAYKEAGMVLEDANNQAAEIMRNATEESNALKTATNQYMDSALANVQSILNSSIEALNVNYDALVRSLETNLEVANRDRKAYNDSQKVVDRSNEQIQAERTAIAAQQGYEQQEPAFSQQSYEQGYANAAAPAPAYGADGQFSQDTSVEDALYQTGYGAGEPQDGGIQLM